MPWERYNGDDVEAAVAMMLLRQHPRGQRIRPAQGDGGVDVLIPHASNRWEVFQIKKFAATRDRSHERQITKSWQRLLTYTQEMNIRVTAWHVVRPIDPTHSDREWLADLTQDSGIPADWIGLTTIDNWAADYPEVIDYWFNNGQQHILDTALTLVQALNATGSTEPQTVLQPVTALANIRSIVTALDNSDPVYRYRVSAELAPENSPPVIRSTPGSVFSAVVVQDGMMSQLDIIARYNEAHLDQPLPIGLAATLTPDSDQDQRQLDDFLAYGIPFTGIPATIVTTELPGGFSFDDMEEVFVSILPEDELQPFELHTIDEDDVTAATLSLIMQRPTEAIDGSGRVAWTGHDVADVLTVTFRIDPIHGTTNVGVSLLDVSGANPANAETSLIALQQLRAGRKLQVRFPGGPSVLSLGALPENVINDDIEEAHVVRLAICAALRTLQAKIPRRLTVPDLSTVDQLQAVGWIHAAMLLDGRPVTTTWSGLKFTKHTANAPLHLPCWVRVVWHNTVSIDGADWNLGYVLQTCKAGQWTPIDDAGSGILTAGDDPRLILAPAPGTEENNQALLGRVHTMPVDQT